MPKMNLREALAIVLDLANQNITDDHDMADKQAQHDEACKIVAKLGDIVVNDDKLAAKCGYHIIQVCGFHKKSNGRVDLPGIGGDKTPTGVTRTIFNIFSDHTMDNV